MKNQKRHLDNHLMLERLCKIHAKIKYVARILSPEYPTTIVPLVIICGPVFKSP